MADWNSALLASYPFMPTRTIDLPTYQNEDEYTGTSMEDFYDYLLTPRHQREETKAGAFTHYGPSRYASVRPEDAELAEFIFNQMLAGDSRDYENALRESNLKRVKGADEILYPSGRGGGEITFTGGAGQGSAETRFGKRGRGWEQGSANAQTLPVGPGPGGAPAKAGGIDEMTRMQILAGSGAESGVAQAEAASRGYLRGGQMTKNQRQTNHEQAADRRYQVDAAAIKLEILAQREKGWENKSLDEIIAIGREDPRKLPPFVREAYLEFEARLRQAEAALGGEPVVERQYTGQNSTSSNED